MVTRIAAAARPSPIRVRRARPRQALRGPTRAARTLIWTAASARRHAQTNTDAGRRWSTCTGNVRRNGQAGQSDTASPTLPDHPDGDGADWVGYTYPRRLLAPPGALDSQLRRLSANRQAEKPMKCAASQRARRRRFSLCLARAPEARWGHAVCLLPAAGDEPTRAYLGRVRDQGCRARLISVGIINRRISR